MFKGWWEKVQKSFYPYRIPIISYFSFRIMWSKDDWIESFFSDSFDKFKHKTPFIGFFVFWKRAGQEENIMQCYSHHPARENGDEKGDSIQILSHSVRVSPRFSWMSKSSAKERNCKPSAKINIESTPLTKSGPP